MRLHRRLIGRVKMQRSTAAGDISQGWLGKNADDGTVSATERATLAAGLEPNLRTNVERQQIKRLLLDGYIATSGRLVLYGSCGVVHGDQLAQNQPPTMALAELDEINLYGARQIEKVGKRWPVIFSFGYNVILSDRDRE